MAGPDQWPGLREGFARADAQPAGAVGQICETCPDNWVEAGARDEETGKPLTGLGYRVYDLASGDQVASGILNAQGEGPRHPIPTASQQLYVVYGTQAAMDEAEGKIGEIRRQRALELNARPDWNGIPAGLEEGDFNDAFDARTRELGDRPRTNPGFFEGAFRGGKRLWDLATTGSDREFYLDERARGFDEYQLVTGAREASRWESFFGGGGQGVSFGFGDEAMAGLDAMMTSRTYEEAVAARRQIMEAQRIANPGTYIGGEVAGAIPTIFVPVGGAAANAARAGRTTGQVVRAGAATGAATGAVSGAGHDEGGLLDRLDGAALGAATGGAAGAVMAGAGVLVARGIAKTRIWGRFSRETRDDLLAALRAGGHRHSPEDIMRIERMPDGRVVFLERGNSRAGFNHVIGEHADDFARRGISEEELPDFLMGSLRQGRIVGYQGSGQARPIYEWSWNGAPHRTAITVGDNGFLVGANPVRR